jgi:hypothetical protein
MADFSKLKLLAQNAPVEQAAKLAKKEKGLLDKGMDLLSAPQKYASEKLAEVAGLKAGETSEENYAALADLAGDKLGVPRDSTAGNAVKAGAVALAEVFGDPLGFIPVGKVAKGIKGLGKLGPLQAVAKVAEESGAAAKAVGLAKPKLVAQAAEVQGAKMAKNVQIAKIAEKLKLPEKTATEQMWLATHPKPNLRPELRGKGVLDINRDIKAAQEARMRSIEKPGPAQAKQLKDMDTMNKAIEYANKNASPETWEATVRQFFLQNRNK